MKRLLDPSASKTASFSNIFLFMDSGTCTVSLAMHTPRSLSCLVVDEVEEDGAVSDFCSCRVVAGCPNAGYFDEEESEDLSSTFVDPCCEVPCLWTRILPRLSITRMVQAGGNALRHLVSTSESLSLHNIILIHIRDRRIQRRQKALVIILKC